jgi:hypothetical protein
MAPLRTQAHVSGVALSATGSERWAVGYGGTLLHLASGTWSAVPAGQEHQAAAQDKGIRGAQPLLQRRVLLLAQRAHKVRWSHARQRAKASITPLATDR